MEGEQRLTQPGLFQEERSPEREDQERLLELFSLMSQSDRGKLLADLSMRILIELSKSAVPGSSLPIMLPCEEDEINPTGFAVEFLSDIQPKSVVSSYLGEDLHPMFDDAWHRSLADAILGSASDDEWMAIEMLGAIDAYAEDMSRPAPVMNEQMLEAFIFAWRQNFMEALMRLKMSSESDQSADEKETGEDGDMELLHDRLVELMPRNSMVIDLWDWGIHFENETFECIEAAFASDTELADYAESLADNFLQWIDEYGMDYNQSGWASDDDFEEWIREQCLAFMKGWRENVRREFGR